VARRKQRELWASPPPLPPAGSFYYQHLFCRTHFILPWTPEGPPSMSSTSVVAGAGPTASTPQGARHQRLQLRWWPLSNLPTAPPRGPTINVSNSAGGRCQTCRQHPLGGPPSTSPILVVAAAGPAASTPQGAHHRRFAKPGTCRQNFSSDIYQGGHCGKHYHYKQATWRKNGGRSFGENFLGPYSAKNPGIIIPLQKLSPNQRTGVRHYQIIRIIERGGKATARWKVYASTGSLLNRSATA
jgi:hypothetical protein